MIQIKKFHSTDFEFQELARIDNLVNHDSISHPDDDKNSCKIKDNRLIRDRLLLYYNDILMYVKTLIGGGGGNRTHFQSICPSSHSQA